jgi:hypothetical protein
MSAIVYNQLLLQREKKAKINLIAQYPKINSKRELKKLKSLTLLFIITIFVIFCKKIKVFFNSKI